MAHVWDDARNTYSNIIDVYASRLRRKIDDGENVALFTTMRGADSFSEGRWMPSPASSEQVADQPARRRRAPRRG